MDYQSLMDSQSISNMIASIESLGLCQDGFMRAISKQETRYQIILITTYLIQNKLLYNGAVKEDEIEWISC